MVAYPELKGIFKGEIMSANFEIRIREAKDNLYMELKGDFDGSSAWELVNTIMLKDKGIGKIFVNTDNVGEVIPFGSAVFESLVGTGIIPKERLLFSDKKYLGQRLSKCRLLSGNGGDHCKYSGVSSNCSIR